jgi:EAL domain-containing protein (putative c-di-GMP-specific phosphodiesterase class I)/CHASE2 domain-containing sensor protein
MSVAERAKSDREAPRWKLLAWIAALGLLFGAIGAGDILENGLRVLRNSVHQHPASGSIVFLKIDDKSMNDVGTWPWPRSVEGRVVDALSDAGAKKIMLDISFSSPSVPAEDRALAESMKRAGNVWLFTRSRVGKFGEQRSVSDRPIPLFARHSHMALADVDYNFQNAVWKVPYAGTMNGQKVRSFATELAGRDGPVGKSFPVDYSIDVESIPTYSTTDLLSGRLPKSAFAGKDVMVGSASETLNDIYFLPGQGHGFGAQVQIIAAETLLSGTPRDWGWIPSFLLALVVAAIAQSIANPSRSALVVAGGALVLLLGPIPLEAWLNFVDVTPGLFMLSIVGGAVGWRRYRARGLVNDVTGLPNLNALRVAQGGRDKSLIAARVLNYEEILAALPPNSERQLVEQIVSRIGVGSTSRLVYQGDGGIFAWFDDSNQAFGNHLEALSALFRTPARVAGLSLDLSITFGVEVGSGRSVSSRLASALVAADEAAHDGLKWKFYDPEAFADASWRLSMLSQLDDAIDQGEVWVAYQPKLDLATRKVVGAEALARWTHPEKGPIAATEFVAAAEQGNRIAKLTDFVLERAVAAAAEIHRMNPRFDMAVNLSARLLTDKQFILRLSALLARHQLDPKHLTLELTETAALTGSGEGIGMITRLRELGVRIAIDDYGTGLSTLDYLKKIPANEIKIDQSFVKGIVDNRSDRLMVQSTIGLAHSLGRQVVAEGVEHRDILDVLIELNCDIAQGFAVGRPMSLDNLTRRLVADRKRSAA